MWLIGMAVVFNVVGLFVASRAVLYLYNEREGVRGGGSLSHGLGLAGLLLGGCLLMASGQYQVLALLYPLPHDRFVEDFDPVTKAGVICGVAMIGIGSVLMRLRRTAQGDAPAVERRPRAIVAALVALVVLTGMNLYQYVSHNRQMSDSNRMTRRQTPEPAMQAARRARVDTQVVREFAREFHDNVFAEEANRPRWFGIETLQNPNDAWITQEIVHAVKPDFIVETGTYNGGSALMWAMVLREVNPKGRVLTVDITDTSVEARSHDIWKERIDFFLGSSTDPKIFADIEKRVRGAKVLVILDSHHGYEHVLAELKLYSPLVNVGSYIVQDTYIDYPPAFHPQLGPGPWAAVKAFLLGNVEFEIDDSRERMLFTFNPKSQLKRVK